MSLLEAFRTQENASESLRTSQNTPKTSDNATERAETFHNN